MHRLLNVGSDLAKRMSAQDTKCWTRQILVAAQKKLWRPLFFLFSEISKLESHMNAGFNLELVGGDADFFNGSLGRAQNL